ncbi:hypothetical protein E2F43_09450 [Seongchinamella unica]|uniref:DUF1214 domain-containing protein n=1 Tax=Seongchinamella unica TaxID=2547392 RepID=A0A4R5LS67_9GAMM|nr:hypothetical protein [Seongchinamella unica]TDG13732.1 hypothetical protein E2F43_09450 [Seongchinamella unica]
MTHRAEDSKEAELALRSAFDDLLGELQVARDTIDDPGCFPPQPTDRNLAEGYRYLTGFMHHAIERCFHDDPDFPAFRNALSVVNKSTIDNSDAIYFYAGIDGRKRYRIRGNAGNHSHWQGKARSGEGPFAPQYLIFEVTTGPLSGDTGNLRELTPGQRVGFGTVDSSRLMVQDDGSFELLLAPEKPVGYEGNFICTRKDPGKRNPEGDDRYAEFISGRQLFYDWEQEEAIHLEIECLDTAGSHPAPLTAEKVAANLRTMGAIVRGQMRFWLQFYDVVLNCNQTHDSAGRPYAMPVNAYNAPNAASGDTGGGMSTNIYAGGIYDLAEDEALYIEAEFSGNPVYTSMHLGNLWGESPDYANHQSSLNLSQMHIGADGKQRWVVAHRDPGVQNWVDTTGLPRGYLSHRWAYPELPPKEQWPTISCRVIPFAEIQAAFPPDQPTMTPEQRRQEIRKRQRHVQRRYRVF